ncbi:hypothetical protein ACYULU_01865 [Breznakiellaceae bacterium SP9]
MEDHSFNFAGGYELSKMGATWFVSYLYYTKINNTHANWQNVETSGTRAAMFRRTTQYHEFWLTQIVDMNDRRLNTNTIGLNAVQTKQMARELLTHVTQR